MTRPRRTLLVAFGIYAVVTLACALTTAPERLSGHTPYNHFALLADGWLHGRLDLGGPPPAYTGNNDFALLNGRWFVSFPPFPAVLIAPFVALSGGAEATRDGLFWLLLTGVGPAILFLALDKLSKIGRSDRTERENAALSLVFALGTVYWFTAVQGTVWFAAHVVGVALTAGYLYASLDAAHPVAAGLLLALGFASRPSIGYAFPLFLYEAYRAAAAVTDEKETAAAEAPKKKKKGAEAPGPRVGRADAQALVEKLAAFGAPAAFVLSLLIWHNRARFGDPFEFGHRLLQIGWKGRIEHWGLFSYHYLGRNLGVALTSLPYTGTPGAPFQINVHGLALWITSPFYAWALWPRRTGPFFWALAATALSVALPNLTYQNTGWMQFGFRFSNDFAPFLFALIAVGGRRLSIPFWVLVGWAVLVNGFGAVTFQRGAFARFYFVDGSQRVLYQPD
jgi:hypothetical protein